MRTAAVAIDGAEPKGKANDKEVCGDAVGQRRSRNALAILCVFKTVQNRQTEKRSLSRGRS